MEAHLHSTKRHMNFSILVQKEGDLFVAHCLELDIVTASHDQEQVQKDIKELICAQVDYAFSNDNLENLFHPAPPEVWERFWGCINQIDETVPIESSFGTAAPTPPTITASTCLIL